jgi:endo-1,4-beta-xylanase
LIRILLWILIITGNFAFLAHFWNLMQSRVPVLCFHRVLAQPDPLSLWISQKKFREILDYLKDEGYETYRPGTKISAGQRPVILSFDDGTRDHIEFVMPELKVRSLKGIFFWVSSQLEGLDDNLKESLKVGGADHLHGSHSRSHRPILANGAGVKVNEIREELTISSNVVSGFFSRPVRSFAFPMGSFDETGARIAREYYQNLFSLDYGYYAPNDPAQIHGRFLVLQETSLEMIKAYLLESRPLEGEGFLYECILILFANIFFWLKNRSPR